MKRIYSIFLLFACSLFLCSNVYSQSQTVGLFSHLSGSDDDGYVLFAPTAKSDTSYLIDKCGRLVHTWASTYPPGLDVYLLEDGTLLRSGHYPNPVFDPSGGSDGGIIERFDWNGNLLWHYIISDSLQTQNHDICYMPNGNILVAIWEVISDSEALANGRMPSLLGTSGLWSAKVIEIKPIGTDSAVTVWKWRLWDHIIQDYDSTKPNYGVVADHPELLNLNYIDTLVAPKTDPDWIHLNAVTYNQQLNQVLISAHNLNEIWILDHSTDSNVAATHIGGQHNKGGDFMYRWGNQAVYDRGNFSNIKLFQQHDPEWIKTGKYANQIMIFNNGYKRPGTNYSSVDIINPPIDSAGDYTIDTSGVYGPSGLSFSYYSNPPITNFFSTFMGGAQMLENGNILICQAMQGRFFEIDSSKNVVWNYVNPVANGVPKVQSTPIALYSNAVYRCTFYPSSYAGFSGHDLVPGTRPIEQNPLPNTCNIGLSVPSLSLENSVDVFPNPANGTLGFRTQHLISASLMDLTGRMITKQYYNTAAATIGEFNTANIANGIYILCINDKEYKKIVVQH